MKICASAWAFDSERGRTPAGREQATLERLQEAAPRGEWMTRLAKIKTRELMEEKR